MNKKIIWIIICIALMISIIFCLFNNKKVDNQIIQTSGQVKEINKLNNTKIGWGIKREKDHKQPDLGAVNKNLINKYEGICLGNSEKKYLYLTFDEGYEAGYTEKILESLRNNNVKATFFITAHYLNTREDLVKKMIDEGHIVGNHTPKYLMSGNGRIVKC